MLYPTSPTYKRLALEKQERDRRLGHVSPGFGMVRPSAHIKSPALVPTAAPSVKKRTTVPKGPRRTRKPISPEELARQVTLCAEVLVAVCQSDMEARWLKSGCRTEACSFSRRIIAYICLERLQAKVQCLAVARATGVGPECISLARKRCHEELGCPVHRDRISQALERLRQKGVVLKVLQPA